MHLVRDVKKELSIMSFTQLQIAHSLFKYSLFYFIEQYGLRFPPRCCGGEIPTATVFYLKSKDMRCSVMIPILRVSTVQTHYCDCHIGYIERFRIAFFFKINMF